MFGSPVKREPGLRNDRCFILKCFATFEPLKKVRSSRVSQLLGPQGLRGELPYTITFCSVDRSQKPKKFPPLGRQASVVAKLLFCCSLSMDISLKRHFCSSVLSYGRITFLFTRLLLDTSAWSVNENTIAPQDYITIIGSILVRKGQI